ncbi:DUF1642 domain-containing protein [Lactococcus cremoris]|uniref:DUF1642 domain-containing protein n=1 Tax=Lactococcus lactis subsp. cremoris TaxID=1359 RepID=UPI002FC86C31
MIKEMKRPISNITQDSIKPLLSNAVEFYTNKNREAHKCIQERDEYINYLESKLSNAKPQLFYLREKNTGYYLRKTGNNRYEITAHYSNDSNEKYMHYKFTQQEIDSMETGSYEQIEVAE